MTRKICVVTWVVPITSASGKTDNSLRARPIIPKEDQTIFGYGWSGIKENDVVVCIDQNNGRSLVEKPTAMEAFRARKVLQR